MWTIIPLYLAMAGLLTCGSFQIHRLPILIDSGFVVTQSPLTALVQRYGFAPYSLFIMFLCKHDTLIRFR